jgi:hypothetical protein
VHSWQERKYLLLKLIPSSLNETHECKWRIQVDSSQRPYASLIDAQTLTSHVLYVVRWFTRPLWQFVNPSAPSELALPLADELPWQSVGKALPMQISEK